MKFLSRLTSHKPALVGFIVICLLLLIAFFAGPITRLLGIDPYSMEILARFSPPDHAHILGTDESGRDFLARIIYGAKVSLGVAVLSAAASVFIGVLIGSLAGYYGKWADSLLMRLTDMLLALPLLPVMILLAALDFSKIPGLRIVVGDQDTGVAKLVFILVIFSWMTVARLVRGQILKLKELEFVSAARSLGMSDARIIIRHILPSVVPTVTVAVTLTLGQQILFESALSFLGLGIQPPLASWGNMLNNAIETLRVAPMLVFIPGFLILVTVVSFNFLGDGLEYALDPKSNQTDN
ncbi:ABC transporter permease [bacterium]|nr:ABC transporter permease [bacterium]